MSPQTSGQKSYRALVVTFSIVAVFVLAIFVIVASPLFGHGSKQAASGPAVTPTSGAVASTPAGPSDPMKQQLLGDQTVQPSGGSDCDNGLTFTNGKAVWLGETSSNPLGTAPEIDAYRCGGQSELRGKNTVAMAVVPNSVDYDACLAAATSGTAKGVQQYSALPVGTTICGKSQGSLVWRLTLVTAPSSSTDPGVWKVTAWGLPTAIQ